jgi:hypothetical protein
MQKTFALRHAIDSRRLRVTHAEGGLRVAEE